MIPNSDPTKKDPNNNLAVKIQPLCQTWLSIRLDWTLKPEELLINNDPTL